MTTASPILIAATAVFLVVATPAYASGSYGIYTYSQEASDGTASAGGSISYHEGVGGSRGSQVSYGNAPTPGEGPSESAEPAGAPTSSSSPVVTPCVRAGEAEVSPCYGVVPTRAPAPAEAPSGRRRQPPVNPGALAASVADRLALAAGRIEASPSAQVRGLTGVASWFWLAPSPSPRSLSAALRGERVSVSATVGSVGWSFGDRTSSTGGPGVTYRDGAVPAGAIRHVYQTRCLPGDAGRDPYVLASCGAGGYTITATVQWTISYTAAGPVAGGGSLPARTTATSTTYPVSEARGFLTAGGAS